jgi:hypothetical protein
MKKHDKLIHTVASKYILGESVNIEIKGNKPQLQKLSELLDVSKQLYECLSDKKTPLQEIMNLIEKKKKISDDFYNLAGIKWKL